MLSLLPKKLFRIRMSRNFGMKMITMTNLSTECLIQLIKLGYDASFFQAEDGIRDADVTGVQTCALPIFDEKFFDSLLGTIFSKLGPPQLKLSQNQSQSFIQRSEERRVGKEFRYQSAQDDKSENEMLNPTSQARFGSAAVDTAIEVESTTR